jgi:hypothetical protein
MVNLAHSEDLADPLSRALQPPLNETQEQRAAREAKEADAKRVSDRIDEQIRSEKQANLRNPAPVKVLMLGQAWFTSMLTQYILLCIQDKPTSKMSSVLTTSTHLFFSFLFQFSK